MKKRRGKLDEDWDDDLSEGTFQSFVEKSWKYIRRHQFVSASLGAVVLGMVFGMLEKRYFPLSDWGHICVKLPGDVLMNMLQIVTIPLVVTSVVKGVADLSQHASKVIAMRALTYMVSTTIIAVSLGLILVLTIEPGKSYTLLGEDLGTGSGEKLSFLDTLLDLLRNMIPHNLVQACFQQLKTTRFEFQTNSGANSSLEKNTSTVQVESNYVDGDNTLGLIVFSFILGRILRGMGEEGKLLDEIFEQCNAITKKVVDYILCYLPFGVMSIIAGSVIDIKDWDAVDRFSWFILTVLSGLTIHAVVILPFLYYLFVRRNPWHVIDGVSPALISALIISSSSATLPITIRCCVDGIQVDRRNARFMMPIGNTINMDGSALYEVIAIVFIAQINNVSLDTILLIKIVVTALVSSLAAAAIPAQGGVTTLFVLAVVGLPAKDAHMLFTIEWLLDRVNTIVNVLGDSFGVALVNDISQKELDELDRPRTPNDAQGLAQGPTQGPAPGPGQGPAQGPALRPTQGPAQGPGQGPAPGPGQGPGQGPAQRPAQRPGQGPAQRPAQGWVQGPAQGPVQGPAQGPVQGPVQGPAQGPAQRPAQGPTQRPAQRPDEGPVQGPGEGSGEVLTYGPTERPAQGPVEGCGEGFTYGPTEGPAQGPDKELNEGPAQRPAQRPDEGPVQGPTEGPTEESGEVLTYEPTEGPAQRPDEGSGEGLTYGPTEGPDEEPDEGPAQRPDGESVQGPAQRPTEGPTEGSGERLAYGPTEGPAQRPDEGSGEGPAQGPTQGPDEGPGQRPGEGSGEGPAQGPDEGLGEGSCEEPTEGPTEGLAQGPAQCPAQGLAQGPPECSAQGPAECSAQGPAECSAQGPAQCPAQGPAQGPAESKVQETSA